MTELQIKAASLEEEKRHNRATEKLTHAQNEAAKEHYQTSDAYTAAHYQYSDVTNRISANAAAMNAATNQSKFQMEYDIEYGWTGSEGYPEGMPLSAQRKNAELAYLINYTVPQTEAQTEKIKSETDLNQSNIEKNQAQIVNSYAGAGASVLNSVFGKGGLVGYFD